MGGQNVSHARCRYAAARKTWAGARAGVGGLTSGSACGVAVLDQAVVDAAVSSSELRTAQMPRVVSTWEIADMFGDAACAEGVGSYLRLPKFVVQHRTVVAHRSKVTCGSRGELSGVAQCGKIKVGSEARS